MSGDPRELMLHLETTLGAPPVTVFAAFVEPEKLARWWGPAGFTASEVDLDVREGGGYRITMQPPDAEPFHLRGTYREIDPAQRLVLTFAWEEPDPDDRETVVTLAFLEHAEGTKVVLDQGTFGTEDRRALHEAGWSESLDRLRRFLG